MKPFKICPATTEHLQYVDAVVQAIADASRAKGTGLALRSHDYARYLYRTYHRPGILEGL